MLSSHTTLQVMTVVPYTGKVATEGYIILHVPTTGVSVRTSPIMKLQAQEGEQSVLPVQTSQYLHPASLQVQPTLMKARTQARSMEVRSSSQVMMSQSVMSHFPTAMPQMRVVQCISSETTPKSSDVISQIPLQRTEEHCL